MSSYSSKLFNKPILPKIDDISKDYETVKDSIPVRILCTDRHTTDGKCVVALMTLNDTEYILTLTKDLKLEQEDDKPFIKLIASKDVVKPNSTTKISDNTSISMEQYKAAGRYYDDYLKHTTTVTVPTRREAILELRSWLSLHLKELSLILPLITKSGNVIRCDLYKGYGRELNIKLQLQSKTGKPVPRSRKISTSLQFGGDTEALLDYISHISPYDVKEDIHD